MSHLPPALLVSILSVQIIVAGEITSPDLDTPYDQWTWLATHNAYANPDEGFALPSANQPQSITDQLNYGVRVLNPDIWLVRQELVGIPLLGTCKCEFEEYPGESTKPRRDRFKTLPLEVVVAHGGSEELFGGFLKYCTEWKSFRQVLTEIRRWVEDHPQEVITLALENKIHSDHQSRVLAAFEESGLEKHIFYVNRDNPDMPAPEGRPGGWSVSKYGYPTLRQLVESGKTVVRAVDIPAAPGLPDQWYYDVSTVYGAASLNPNTWANTRSESWPINEFTRGIFSLVHIPDLPQEVDHQFEAVNSIFVLRDKWNDIRAQWNRLPNVVYVDYYNKGISVNPASPRGPAQFVNELNTIWKSLPAITPVVQVVPAPPPSGWHNTDVHVTLSGTGDTIQAITSRTFGAHEADRIPANKSSYTLTRDGITTVTFSVVGNLGNRSPTMLTNIAIDRLPPIITGMPDRPPDYNGWYASNVTVRFVCSDAASGVAYCPPDVTLRRDGARQSVSGTAVDRAGNRATTIVTNINIDAKGPVICAEAKPASLKPKHGKPAPAIISGTITDAGSGVDPSMAAYEVWDEYNRCEPSGRITLDRRGRFTFLLRLEADRLGQDRDGRKYLITLHAADRAGHSEQTVIPLIVRHDNRRDHDHDHREDRGGRDRNGHGRDERSR